ncbi:MAG TPA: hypothetical protein VK652_08600 [Steroidobacteraceae bacterium]|nr:hypothetical protein [Steroidobacteraceae bacterium]
MADERGARGQFLAGEKWAGNKNGRPKGSPRKELAREFIEDMQRAWETNGAQVLAQVIQEDPAAFLRSMVAIMPKELDVNVNHYDDMSDDQIRQQFIAALREARALGVDIGDGGASSVH